MNKKREICVAVLVSITLFLQACAMADANVGNLKAEVIPPVESGVEYLVTPTQNGRSIYGASEPVNDEPYTDVFF